MFLLCGENEVCNALIGTLILMGSIILLVYCCYKYAICREEENKRKQIIIVSQSVCSQSVCSQDVKKYSSLV